MDILCDKYKNILLCMGPKYRNWILVDNEYMRADFEKNMNANKYIIHLYYLPTEYKFVYVVLFHQLSPYLSKTEIFRKFLDILINVVHKSDEAKKKKFLEKYLVNVNGDVKKITKLINADKLSIETIFITKKDLTTYFLRNILIKNKNINLTVHNYLHRHFLLDMGNAPLCGKHTVLSKHDVGILCSQQLMTSRLKLPFIFITDPQIIWCGAKVGDVVEIKVPSELTGIASRYRVVVPPNGKIQNISLFSEIDEDEYDGEVPVEAETEAEVDAEADVDADPENVVNNKDDEVVSDEEFEEFDEY